MGDTINRLYRLNFPDCTREALSFLTSYISQDCPAIPGLNANTEQVIVEICQEFVLFKSVRGPPKKLSAIQELNLLDMICACFKEAPEKSKYRIFNLMFGAHCSGSVNLLTKLVSLALSTCCAPVLFCVAIWMQERDSLSTDVKGLTQRLVSDYCLLYPDPSNVFSKLPSVSPLFACNFITSATSYYSFGGADSLPPLALLQHLSEWLDQDNTLCCESLRQATIHHAYTTPVPGLTGWCVRGPLVCSLLLAKAKETASGGRKEIGDSAQVLVSLMSCLDKLHLALLQSLAFSACVNLSPGLLSAGDLAHITHTLTVVLPQPSSAPQQQKKKQRHKESLTAESGKQWSEVDGEVTAAISVALERLAQILQVASGTRTYVSDIGKVKEMESVVKHKLPENRLLSMVLKQQMQATSS